MGVLLGLAGARSAEWEGVGGRYGVGRLRGAIQGGVMEPVAFYKRFNQDFFYHFHKHSTDLELEELGTKYAAWLEKNGSTVNDILTGESWLGELREEARRELGFPARMEAMRDVGAVRRGEYKTPYGIERPDRLSS